MPAAPGDERVRTDHAHLHRNFARPDVGEVRTAARDVVIERGENLERGVEALRRQPPSRRHDRIAATDVVVGDPGEVERDPVAGTDAVDP